MVRNFLIFLFLAIFLTSCFGTRTEFHRKRYNYRFLAESESEDNCIDKTKLYELISVESKYGGIRTKIKSGKVYLKFYEEGKVGKFYNYDTQDLESLNPLKANMGYYQCNDSILRWATYFDHPQGGKVFKEDYIITKDSLITLEGNDYIRKYKPIFLNKDFLKYQPDW